MNYLRQVGKIKSFSRTHMKNSDLVLSEEELFTEIHKKVNSLSLQLKLKDIVLCSIRGNTDQKSMI